MSRLQHAVERIYGDVALTDELRDDEAQFLLEWGEQEVEHLDEQTDNDDEQTFQARFKQIRSIIKRVNRLVGYRTEYTPAEAREKLTLLLDDLRELGRPINEERVERFLDTYQQMGDGEAVAALLDIIQPPEETLKDAPDLDDVLPDDFADGTNDDQSNWTPGTDSAGIDGLDDII